MKKIAAILLTALFLFNLFGYRFLFNYQQQQSDIRLEASLDKDQYDEADLMTITLPLSLPYQNDQEKFERVNGEITINGTIYKYVKRKISGGNLVLLCLPNENKMILQSAKNDFFKNSNDLTQNNHSKKSDHSKDGIFKNLPNEYLSDSFSNITAYTCIIHDYSLSGQLNYLPSAPHSSPEQPPEIL